MSTQSIKLHKSCRPGASRRGFALVVTLSLMILLTIIAVGLLTLSAVSLRVSSQGQAAAEARANARLALMMAIGELQREMGPDSRISAPHDAGTTASGGQPHWTAVYDAWKRPENPGTPETPQSRNPKFRGWLGSGANVATGGPAGTGEDPVPLVGRSSLGASSAPGDQVSVPMHAVSVGSQRGRIAWWTADEGIKAKINAGPDDSGNTTVTSNPLFQAQSPPHVGQRAIPGLEDFDWKPGQRAMAISTPEVNLAANLSTGTGVGNLNHNLTVHSAGVLADVRGGRLKRDLTNLLTRPIGEVEDKPLYLAGGRMNRFEITRDGAVSNSSLPTDNSGANSREMNLEELYMFHNLHREIDWSTGKPRLVNKNTKEKLVDDRFFIYKQPVFEAVQIILSFKAVPDGGVGTYQMQGMLDAMIAVSNPNDVPIVWPSSLVLGLAMHSLPYYVKWNISKADGSKITHSTGDINNPYFKSKINDGFTIEPGEAAVFGNSTADTAARNCTLKRGFNPSGGVTIRDQDWGRGNNQGLRANGLKIDDIIDFTLTKKGGTNNTNSSWVLLPREIQNSSGGDEWSISRVALGGNGGSITGEFWDQYLTKQIRPPQALPVSEFIGDPKPVMLLTFMPNVEKSREDLLPHDAFPSRPFQLREPAFCDATIASKKPEETFHSTQWLVTCEPMDYTFANLRTLPKGDGGINIYHGRARHLELGGSFHVVRRRVPLAPPLSIGAFENAIAIGLENRFQDQGPGQGSALYRRWGGIPAMAKTIGNSWSNPFLTADSVRAGAYHDVSWMANTALWDSWFLSGIVDGTGIAPSAWGRDPRSPREQFRQLAESSAPLRNTRFSYHPHKSITEALDELFDGDVLKPSAINKLPEYLLVDGAFNVNSTSVAAWKAFLTSVRDQELLDANGVSQRKNHPFGTLGYAVSQATTSGTERDWQGFRDLTELQIDNLANAIVTEVKDRGPFLSMADFVNRRPNSSDKAHQALGALQAAIDKSGLNDDYKAADRAVKGTDFAAVLPAGGAIDVEPGGAAARSVGSAGYLSQGALLTALGSQITVRSDTFLIRTYGDSRDASGKIILAKAWCEAVVQRVPEYVDPADLPEDCDGWPTAGDALTPANSLFGRRMVIRSFRWLGSEEI